MTQPEDIGQYLDANLTPTPGAINYGNERITAMMRDELGDEAISSSLAHVSRLGVGPGEQGSLVPYSVPIMLINHVEGGPIPKKRILTTIGMLGVGNLCWVASHDAVTSLASRYDLAYEEVATSDAINWRKEAGMNLESCMELANGLDMRVNPGDVPVGTPAEPNMELIEKMNDLMVLQGQARIMLATSMLSGHQRSFAGVEKAANQLEAKLDRSVFASELVKMDVTTSRRAMVLAREIAAQVGVMPYMTYTALKEVVNMSKDLGKNVSRHPEMLRIAREEQRRALAIGGDARVRRAIERRFRGDGPISIDIETPDGETLHITGGTIVDVVREVKTRQVATEERGKSEDEQPILKRVVDDQPKSAIDMMPQAQQLDFEILPEGGLEGHVRRMARAKRAQVARGSKKGAEQANHPEVSNIRMQAMQEIVELWGAENVDFYTGNFNKRRKKKLEISAQETAAQTQPEQPQADTPETQLAKEVEVYDDFILIVLKDYDSQGSLKGEHIIAESPFETHEHSLFVLRHDVRTGHGVDRGWDEIMKWHKDDVRKAGARRLQHLSSEAIGGAELMAEKVYSLLTCEPDEFPHLEFGGYNTKSKTMRTWIRGGRTALRGQIEEPEK